MLSVLYIALLPACGSTASSAGADAGALETDARPGGRHAIPDNERTGLCDNGDSDFCGGPSEGNCYCDDECAAIGDCCDDYEETCECQAQECSDLDMACGTHSDGCGGTLDCGACPPLASGPFTLDMPDFVADRYPQRVALSVPSTGEVAVYAEIDVLATNRIALERLGKGDGGWDRSAIVNHNTFTPLPIDATHGDDPCLAYGNLDGLHLRCATLSDRLISTTLPTAMALTTRGTRRDLVFVASGDELHYLGGDFSGQPPASLLIDTAWQLSSVSIASDLDGGVHIAYVSFESSPSRARTLHYAYAPAGGPFNSQIVDSDTWTGNPGEGDTVSLALSTSGSPLIAYHHRATKSMKLATMSAGGFEVQTLRSPTADADDDDSVGRSLALVIDPANNRHLVFAERNAFDDASFIGLRYARINQTGGLEAEQDLPADDNVDYLFYGVDTGLSFHVADDGRQHVAAIVSRNFAYYATR